MLEMCTKPSISNASLLRAVSVLSSKITVLVSSPSCWRAKRQTPCRRRLTQNCHQWHRASSQLHAAESHWPTACQQMAMSYLQPSRASAPTTGREPMDPCKILPGGLRLAVKRRSHQTAADCPRSQRERVVLQWLDNLSGTGFPSIEALLQGNVTLTGVMPASFLHRAYAHHHDRAQNGVVARRRISPCRRDGRFRTGL